MRGGEGSGSWITRESSGQTWRGEPASQQETGPRLLPQCVHQMVLCVTVSSQDLTFWDGFLQRDHVIYFRSESRHICRLALQDLNSCF